MHNIIVSNNQECSYMNQKLRLPQNTIVNAKSVFTIDSILAPQQPLNLKRPDSPVNNRSPSPKLNCKYIFSDIII